MSFASKPKDGTEGTAFVGLHYGNPVTYLKLNACLVYNDENFKKFIQYQKTPHAFIYFYCSKEIFNNIHHIEVDVYRYTKKKSKNKTVNISKCSFTSKETNECHRFLSINFDDTFLTPDFTTFVEDNAKKIPKGDTKLISKNNYKALQDLGNLVKFFDIRLESGNVLAVDNFNKVRDGPLLRSDGSLVGYCIKDEAKNMINVHMVKESQIETIYKKPENPPPGSSAVTASHTNYRPSTDTHQIPQEADEAKTGAQEQEEASGGTTSADRSTTDAQEQEEASGGTTSADGATPDAQEQEEASGGTTSADRSTTDAQEQEASGGTTSADRSKTDAQEQEEASGGTTSADGAKTGAQEQEEASGGTTSADRSKTDAQEQEEASGGTSIEEQVKFTEMYEYDSRVVQELSLLFDKKGRGTNPDILAVADMLKADHIIKLKCRSNYSHSPAKDVLEYPSVATSRLTKLTANLDKCHKRAIACTIEQMNKDPEATVDDFLQSHYEIKEELAATLELPGDSFNWKYLANLFDIDANVQENMERGENAAQEFLVNCAYVQLNREQRKMSNFLEHMKALGRGSEIEDLMKKHKITKSDYIKRIDVLFPPDTEQMDDLCILLNKKYCKDWKNLAARWEIDKLVYYSFIPETHSSATNILLDWLMMEKHQYTVYDFIEVFRALERNDAVELLETHLLKYIKSETFKSKSLSESCCPKM